MIAKIYKNQFSTTPIAIIDEIFELSLDLNLNNGGRGKLVCPFFDGADELYWDDDEEWDDDSLWQSFEKFNIQPYSKIEIYEVENGKDVLVFGGYIYEPTITLTGMELEIRDESDLMNKKLVLSDTTFSAHTPSAILSSIISAWNTETGEDWQVSSDVSLMTTMTVKRGDTIFGVLQELADTMGNNWIVKNQTIYFGTVGEDKSTGPNFQEFVYNGNDHSEDNIIDIRLTSVGTVANLIIGSDLEFRLLVKDLDDRGAIGEYVTMMEGGLALKTEKVLELKKGPIYNYSLEVDSVPWANLGDKVYCRIENSIGLDFSGVVTISRTRIEYKNATLIKTVEIETQIMKKSLLTNRLQTIEKNLNLLLKK